MRERIESSLTHDLERLTFSGSRSGIIQRQVPEKICRRDLSALDSLFPPLHGIRVPLELRLHD